MKMQEPQSSEPVAWTVGPLNEQRRAVRKAMMESIRAHEESKKANLPIVGFRPEYPKGTK